MQHEETTPFKVTIVRFRDGDTLEGFVRCGLCRSSTYVTIRLPAIESWEPKGPDHHKAVQVAEHATRLYRGRTGVLTRTPTRFDNHGRVISDIIIDDTAITILLVNAGLAWYGVREPEPEEASSRLLNTLTAYNGTNNPDSDRIRDQGQT